MSPSRTCSTSSSRRTGPPDRRRGNHRDRSSAGQSRGGRRRPWSRRLGRVGSGDDHLGGHRPVRSRTGDAVPCPGSSREVMVAAWIALRVAAC
jgi:hypothetical protein